MRSFKQKTRWAQNWLTLSGEWTSTVDSFWRRKLMFCSKVKGPLRKERRICSLSWSTEEEERFIYSVRLTTNFLGSSPAASEKLTKTNMRWSGSALRKSSSWICFESCLTPAGVWTRPLWYKWSSCLVSNRLWMNIKKSLKYRNAIFQPCIRLMRNHERRIISTRAIRNGSLRRKAKKGAIRVWIIDLIRCTLQCCSPRIIWIKRYISTSHSSLRLPRTKKFSCRSIRLSKAEWSRSNRSTWRISTEL